MRISRIHKYILDIADKRRRPYFEKRALQKIKENEKLYEALSSYIKRAKTSGASYFDYWMLYRYIRTKKPKEVLECGTGVTTVAMAHALFDNEKENGVQERITSMDEIEKYHQDAIACFPEHLKKYVDFICSPKIEDYYHIFRGVRYRDVPEDRQYDFVYVDGPKTSTPSDRHKTFDFDFIRVVERSEKPVFALVDTRMSTCFAYKHLFGAGKVSFDYINEVGIVGPCTKEDLRAHTNEIIRALGPFPIKRGSAERVLKLKKLF